MKYLYYSYLDRLLNTLSTTLILFAVNKYFGPFDSGYLVLFYFIWFHDVRGE